MTVTPAERRPIPHPQPPAAQRSTHDPEDIKRLRRRSTHLTADMPAAEESRRLKLLKRMGLFTADTKGAVIERATRGPDLIAAYRLVHDAFVEQGYIRAQEGGLRVRPFEALPETATFIARSDSHVVGVQTLAVDSDDLGLPSDGAFEDVLNELRGRGKLVCEATNEAVDKELRRSGVPTELMRCMFSYAVAIGCTDLITTVSPGHSSFYEFLGWHQVSDIRSYSAKINDPTVVMAWDLVGLRDRLDRGAADGDTDKAFLRDFCFDRNPYYEHHEEWARQARTAFMDPAFLFEFLCQRSPLLRQASPTLLSALRARLGNDLVDRLTARQDRGAILATNPWIHRRHGGALAAPQVHVEAWDRDRASGPVAWLLRQLRTMPTAE